MNRPRLLDLFCGAGGAAVGYHRASFEVIGVDRRPQPRYPFSFHQADALEFLAEHGWAFDAIHASPPCQAHCALRHMPNAREHPDLIPETRRRLQDSGRLYVMENVPHAPLVKPVLLCGTMFGLQTECGAQLRRHRLFETNWPLRCDRECQHHGKTISVHGDHPRDSAVREKIRRTICVNGTGLALSGGRTITVTGSTPQRQVIQNRVRESFPVAAARAAMGIDWMTMAELSQAVPPDYTKYIGRQWMKYL